ncbi:MAG: hypothetical protein ACK4Y5_09415 [Acetobacteraceae bacterium]
MGHTEMASHRQRAMMNAIFASKSRAEPRFPAMMGEQIGMKDGAITEGVFQHAVDSGAAGAWKMNKV